MTVKDIQKKFGLEIVNMPEPDAAVGGVYCCDLLSIAMGNAPAGSAWCTVMSNINTLAVAALCDVACVILCHGVRPDEAMEARAKEKGIALLLSEKPIFDQALLINETL